MATIKMVAERAGVSTATVSRALSDPHRVQDDPRAGGERDRGARLCAQPCRQEPAHAARTRKIVVMVPDVSNPFFAEVLRGTEEAAQAAGYSVLLGDTRDDLDREAQYGDMLLRKEADGLIFSATACRRRWPSWCGRAGLRRPWSTAATSLPIWASPASISTTPVCGGGRAQPAAFDGASPHRAVTAPRTVTSPANGWQRARRGGGGRQGSPICWSRCTAITRSSRAPRCGRR
ncbi:LacI family DNA-binding transcriptional regulator [Sphingomonas sp. MMS24-JH45]